MNNGRQRLSSINSSCTLNCVQIKHREMTMTMERVVEENGKTRGDDEYTKDGTVDLMGNPVLRSNTGRWRATSFIVGYEAFERMAFYGISTNLVLYLTRKLHEGTVKSSNNVTNWVGTVWLTPILGAYIADAHLGRYWTFIVSAFIYLGIFVVQQGMSLLTLVVSLKSLRPPSCGDSIKDVDCDKQASPFQVGIFYCALYIIALGTGGTKPNISTMGADQFDEFEPTEKTQKISFFNWWVFSIFFGTLFASTFLVYIQDHAGWGLGYGLPTIGLFLSILVFLAGSPYYRHQPASGSPLTKMARVLIATIRKWDVVVPDDPKELHELNLDEYSKPGKYRIEHSPLLIILDKAAVVDGRSPHWMLCTVTEVEETKQMVKMVPILLVSFLPSTLIAQGHTLFIKQGTTLVRSIGPHFSIPPASLVAFITIFMLITVVIYDKFLVPTLRSYTKNPRGIPMLQRLGIGLVMHVIIMIIASVCERKRLNVIKDHGITKKNQIVPLSIFILLPQYALMGVADTFWEVGRLEFFYDQAPKSMKSLGTAYYTTSLSMGNFLSSFILTTVSDFTKRDGHKGWILDNLNVSRLDYFYAFYAVLSFINLLFFLLAANFFVYNKEQDDATMELENVKDTSDTNAFFKDVIM
ncbi:protein NRT1/ PTR FAMILY 5.2 isoform X3 [Daucus carota subsp. sativus]|uniref:protein NRT1/ PTR FAMILY 5.2 isoform X3 n=1 Tax=Daucus carota subsp. sativus TaxID=79200 RepID=UPI0030832B73